MFLKFAEAVVLGAELAPKGASKATLQRMGHRAHFDYTPRPGYLYVRSRAISSRCNDNFDEFPAEEIKKAYKTFIGKPVFVNHHNDDHRRARGVVIDAALHEDRNPNGTPDTWAEVLMEVDAIRFPKLAQAILAGHVDRTSMGTDVAHSLCSVCGNKATTPAEYCQHIPKLKGQKIYRTDKLGKREAVLVRERCYGLRFFENSLLVEEPADPTAYVVGVVSGDMPPRHASANRTNRGGGNSVPASAHEGQRTAPKGRPTPKRRTAAQKRRNAEKAASLQAVAQESRTAAPMPLRHGDAFADSPDARRKKSHCQTCGGGIFMIMNPAGPTSQWIHDDEAGAGMPHQAQPPESGMDPATGTPMPTSTSDMSLDTMGMRKGAPFAGYDDFEDCTEKNSDKNDPDAYCGEIKHRTEDAKESKLAFFDIFNEDADKQAVDLDDPRGLASHLADAHGWAADDFHQFKTLPHPALANSHDGQSRPYTVAELARIHEYEHTPEGGGNDFPSAQTAGSMHFHGSLFAEAAPKYPNAGDHPALKALNLHPAHIVAHWDMASDEEKGQGQNWYEDAHHIAKAIAKTTHPEWDDKTAAHRGAGVLAAYSPQTSWPVNMMNASRSLREHAEGRPAVGGKGSGVMATGQMRDGAQRVLDGEDYNNVFKGHKITHFAHLIEHGGNKDENEPKVVIDRHSLSVAAGKRLGDDELNPAQNAIGQKHYYDHVANTYHQAAQHINEREGRVGKDKLSAHHVQAATWLVRQRLNQQQDKESGTAMGKGRVSGFEKAQSQWMEHARQHYNINEQNMHMKEVRPTSNPNDDPKALEHWRGAKLAYGETIAPMDVDTLRDEECPVCGSDEYNGDQCQECGFVPPPKFLQDPNLDLAKQLDLRKDVAQGAGELPGAVGDGTEPSVPAPDASGAITDDSQVPSDPALVDEDGNVNADAEGTEVPADEDMMDPDAVDENGDPDVDLGAADKHFNQGGEPFTQGPNAPSPEEPMVPGAGLGEDGTDAEVPVDVQTLGDEPPGTAGDGTPDLVCPNCGFSADAAQPTTTDMDDPMSPDATGPGALEGDACPNCGQAQLMSISDLEQAGVR